VFIEERFEASAMKPEGLNHRLGPVRNRRIGPVKKQVDLVGTGDPAPGKSVTMFPQVSFHCFRIPSPYFREMSDHPRPDLKMALVFNFPDVVAGQDPPTERPEG
jgi:hypothetical protein